MGSYKLPCPKRIQCMPMAILVPNTYTGRRNQRYVDKGNPFESVVTQGLFSPKDHVRKKIKTENSLTSPIHPALKRQEALRNFNVQETMRAQIREAFATKRKVEERLTMEQSLEGKKATLQSQVKGLDSSISTLFDALEHHEKKTSQDGREDENEKDVKATKELMSKLVQRRGEVEKKMLALGSEDSKAKCSEDQFKTFRLPIDGYQLEDVQGQKDIRLQDVLTKTNVLIDSLRQKRYSFDGNTTIEFVSQQMGWNPFAGFPVDARGYFANYLTGSVLKFECEFWKGGSKVVAEKICEIIKGCSNYSKAQMDQIHGTFLLYLKP